jgi:hypothetical protein
MPERYLDPTLAVGVRRQFSIGHRKLGGYVMSESTAVAEAVRQACLEAALEAYEYAGISGLCAEGRWELAVQAIRTLDLQAVLAAPDGPPEG